MYITYIGHNHTHDLDFNIERPDGSGDYLALIIKSHCTFKLNNEIITVDPNTFFLYKEGTPQFYKACKEPFSNDWFHFKLENNESDFFDNLHIPFEVPISLNNVYPLSLIIKTMANEKYSNRLYSKDIIENYMHIFFMEISQNMQNIPEHVDTPHYEEMALLRSKIYNMPYIQWDVKGLAHEIRLSPSHFQRTYKKIFGITCIQDVINARIESAKYYLIETDFSVKHIAEILGYDNYEHFIRQFKNILNNTPSEYRDLHR